MLLCEQSGGDQQGYLAARLYGHEGGAQRDLGSQNPRLGHRVVILAVHRDRRPHAGICVPLG